VKYSESCSSRSLCEITMKGNLAPSLVSLRARNKTFYEGIEIRNRISQIRESREWNSKNLTASPPSVSQLAFERLCDGRNILRINVPGR
jgi:hypothetical protein